MIVKNERQKETSNYLQFNIEIVWYDKNTCEYKEQFKGLHPLNISLKAFDDYHVAA